MCNSLVVTIITAATVRQFGNKCQKGKETIYIYGKHMLKQMTL